MNIRELDEDDLHGNEVDEIDPSFLNVLTTRSLHEGKQAAHLLRSHGYVVQVGAELVTDALMASTAGAAAQDEAHSLGVPGSQAEAAASLLAAHGFESEMEAAELATGAKPWVKRYQRVHALFALTLLLAMVIFAFWALLQF
jgi:hypothetical protein